MAVKRIFCLQPYIDHSLFHCTFSHRHSKTAASTIPKNSRVIGGRKVLFSFTRYIHLKPKKEEYKLTNSGPKFTFVIVGLFVNGNEKRKRSQNYCCFLTRIEVTTDLTRDPTSLLYGIVLFDAFRVKVSIQR